MHAVISFVPFTVWAALAWGSDRWSKRPAARARWARLSLRGKIARQVRILRIAIAYQTGFLVLSAGLRMAGLMSFSGWLTSTIAAVIALAADLYLFHHALAARRAYDDLGSLAYIAEVRHAFGGQS